MSEISNRQTPMTITPLPKGGFIVHGWRGDRRDFEFPSNEFAASTLKETLDFVRKEFAAKEAST